METMLTFFVLCVVANLASFVGSTELDSYLVSVDNVEFHGNGRFPETVGVVLGNQGNGDIYLKLERDDQATDFLSEDLFETSKILPAGVFTEETSNCFAAYNSGNSDVIVLQRESDGDNPRLYGRFTHGNEKMVIQSEDGSHVNHRVRREEKNEHRRVRRSTSDEYLIELFVFTDYSVFEHVRDEFMPAGSTTKEIRAFIKSYITGITKEVDEIYQYLGEYGLNNTFRVYFQQYQIITNTSQQQWVNDNLSGNQLGGSVTGFVDYYITLMDKFAFPYPDHLVQLTRYELPGDIQVSSYGTVCGTGTAMGGSVAMLQNYTYPLGIAQGIAIRFGVTIDSGDCSPSDQYIMSFDYTPNNPANQGNKWKFSSCSVESFVKAFNNSDLSCLQTEDVIFDLQEFDSSPYIADMLTLDEQCVLSYSSGYTFCDPSAVDCYSSAQGCTNGTGICNPMNVPHRTPCNSGTGFVCNYGFCEGTTTTSTTTVSTTATTTEEGGLQTTTVTETPSTPATTTTPDDCEVQTGFVEFDLPGCGCCGGCGCDEECSGCAEGLPSKTQGESCIKEANCCTSKVRMTTLFVPDGCELKYVPGPRTLVMEKKGWENTDADVTAEVYQDSYNRWQVNLVPDYQLKP